MTDSKLAVISPFILLPQVVKLTSQPRSTIIKYSELGLFPPIIRLLGGRIAFVRADVQAWIDSRLAESEAK